MQTITIVAAAWLVLSLLVGLFLSGVGRSVPRVRPAPADHRKTPPVGRSRSDHAAFDEWLAELHNERRTG